MTTTSTDRRSRKGMGRWALTVGGVAVASVAIGTVLLASRWSQIPAIVATHWGPGGGVDATMSRSSFVLTTALLLLGLTIDVLGAGLRVLEVPCDLQPRVSGSNWSAQIHRAKQYRDVWLALAVRRLRALRRGRQVRTPVRTRG